MSMSDLESVIINLNISEISFNKNNVDIGSQL